MFKQVFIQNSIHVLVLYDRRRSLPPSYQTYVLNLGAGTTGSMLIQSSSSSKQQRNDP